MLTVHHLGKSQSERIVWLCEELAVPYELKRYDRDSQTMAAPAAFKALHPLGAAPVITDDGLVLAESGAIMDYVIAKYGDGRFAVRPGVPAFADYLYWLHFVNGTLQAALARHSILSRAGLPLDGPLMQAMTQRRDKAVELVDTRLSTVPYLAGAEFTAADMMMVFTLSTMRYFAPFDLAPYANIKRYLARISERPGYRSAMAKGDPGMDLMLD